MNWEDPGPLVVNIIVNYCCTRVCCTRKRLKETETEDTTSFLSQFYGWWAYQLGGSGFLPSPPGYAYMDFHFRLFVSRESGKLKIYILYRSIWTQSRQRLAIATTFFRNEICCGAQWLGDWLLDPPTRYTLRHNTAEIVKLSNHYSRYLPAPVWP